MSICSIEDVAANATKPFWFQLYVMRNRGFVERLIGRANEARCSALVVTLDLPLAGQRHKILRHGLSVPPRLTATNLIDMAMKPRWCLNMLRTRRRSFGNLAGHVKGVDDMTSLLAWIEQQFALKKASRLYFVVEAFADGCKFMICSHSLVVSYLIFRNSSQLAMPEATKGQMIP